jgi:hypothetical protein
MNQQLTALIADFEAARARLDRLAVRIPDARWAERADPARWSVAECVAHLNLTSRAYVPLLERGLEEARASGAPAPARYRRDPAGWLISTMSGPMPRLGGRKLGRVKTAASFVPTGDLSREALLADFARLQDRQVALTRAADGLPIDRVRVTSPFDTRVKYNLWSAFSVLPRHQHRHLEQAEEVWG